MNKHEKELLTKLFWRLQRNKNEHHIIYNAQETLASILKGEYGIADKLLECLSWGEVPPPLPSNPTPTCPECGSTDIRIVYKDDEGIEIDFYDCIICRTTWKI